MFFEADFGDEIRIDFIIIILLGGGVVASSNEQVEV